MSRLVAKVVEEQQPGQAFGATAIAREVNRRFGKKLRRAVDVRAVGVNLRRLRLAGRIELVREGKAHPHGSDCHHDGGAAFAIG